VSFHSDGAGAWSKFVDSLVATTLIFPRSFALVAAFLLHSPLTR
jgi:hypothetical protein